MYLRGFYDDLQPGMRERTRLIEDQTGRKKLHVTLPGGRYQLSLDDGAVNLLCDSLGYDIGDIVPEPFVPILVATHDAWFPRQRDIESVVADLPTDGSLTNRQREALVEYLTSIRISSSHAPLVKEAIADSPISNTITSDDLQIKSLPPIPSKIDMEGGTRSGLPSDTTQDTESHSATETIDMSASSKTEEVVSDEQSITETDICQIPGIGETRAESLLQGGCTSVEEIADARPADIAAVTALTEQLATVAVEGAREIVGENESTVTRLATIRVRLRH